MSNIIYMSDKKKSDKSITSNEKKKLHEPNDISVDDRFALIELYCSQHNILFSHHSESINKLFDEFIPAMLTQGDKIIDEKVKGNRIYTNRFEFKNITIKPPTIKDGTEYMFSPDALTNNLTYSCQILSDVSQYLDITDIVTDKKTTKLIGQEVKSYPVIGLPLMVGSKYCNLTTKKNPMKTREICNYDPKNYFIVKGNEKVILPLERIRDNEIFVFIKKDTNSIIYVGQVHSKSYDMYDLGMQVISIRLKKDNTMTLKAPMFKEISVFVLLRALGLESDKNIIDYITKDPSDNEMMNKLVLIIEKTKEKSKDDTKDRSAIVSEIDAYNYLLTKIRSLRKYSESDDIIKNEQKRIHLRKLLDSDFMPHVAGGSMNKAIYLCKMINKILQCFLGRIEPDDRDSFVNKRIDLAGDLIGQLIKQSFKKVLNECKKFFVQRSSDDDNPINIIYQIKSSTIEQTVTQAITSGNLGGNTKKGVSQALQRLSYLQTISYFRRFNSPTDSNIKLTSPRHVHNTQIGFVCPVESPEGGKIGLVKNLAFLATFTHTMYDQINVIKKIVLPHVNNYQDIHVYEYKYRTEVFLNGSPLGLVKEAYKLYTLLLQSKLNGQISKYVTIRYNIDNRELRICCDGGRIIRPLLRVENNELCLKKEHIRALSEGKSKISSWAEFLVTFNNVIEYVDPEASEELMIAMYPSDLDVDRKIMNTFLTNESKRRLNSYSHIYKKYTHCEIHPSTMLGIVVSNTIFLNHNQSPRNIFQYSYARHSMSIYSTAYRHRTTETSSFVLSSPKNPLVRTRARKYITDKLPSGDNIHVSIMTYSGRNQEDAIGTNESAFERGLYDAVYRKKILSEVKKNPSTSQDDQITVPNPSKVSGIMDADYSKLNLKGYAPVGTETVNNTVVIGKITPQHVTGADIKPFRDSSEVYRSNLPGFVEKVYPDLVNTEGYPMCKMIISSRRRPAIGDKFACYDEETYILTNTGFILFEYLTMRHKVATLQNNTLVYEHPQEIMKYDYDGEMYHVDTNMVNLLVTPNHDMYVRTKTSKFRKEKAENLLGKVRYYKKDVGDYQPKSHPRIENDKFVLPAFFDKNKKFYPNKRLDLEAWCIFFGIWIAVGCTSRDCGVAFATHKPHVKKQLNICAKKLEYTFTHGIKNENSNEWHISDKQLVHYIYSQSVGAINKRLPLWCFNLTKKYSRALISGMICGGGDYIKETTAECYYTSSYWLAQEFQQLCLHAGYACNMKMKIPAETTAIGRKYKGKQQKITSTVDAYVLTVIKTQTEPIVNEYMYSGKQSDSMVLYKGNVYCCRIKGGVIYVRRKGIASWSCNSTHAQKGVVGAKFRQDDMPFTVPFDNKGRLTQSITPVFITNPHAIPSRMTVAHIIEMICGTIATRTRTFIDGTPFNQHNIEELADIMEELGFNRYGNYRMINGQTGREFRVTIYTGPIYYQRLKHLVFDKEHARGGKGIKQILTRQPTEGRSRDGGHRFGEMERDAIKKGTPVALSCGISIPIEQMNKCNYDVLTWDQRTKTILTSKQTNFKDQGKRPILRITLEDGTILDASTKHPHLRIDDKWIQSKDLKVGDSLKCNLAFPVMNVKKELDSCSRFKFESSTYTFSARNSKEYFKLLAFARITGLITTDGHIPIKGTSSVYAGHLSDLQIIIDDIKLITETKPKFYKCTQGYSIYIPKNLDTALRNVLAIPVGNKTRNFFTFPLVENWPKPMLREFLGAMFGGDGHAPVLTKHRGKYDLIKSVCFSKSKYKSLLHRLQYDMNRLKNMLARFGIINVTINNPKETTISKQRKYEEKCYEVVLQINIEDLIIFAEQIGFRYCTHKALRLQVAVSYRKLLTNTIRQTQWVVDRVRKLTGYVKGEANAERNKLLMNMREAVNKANKELKKKEPLYNKHYSQPNYEMVRDRLKVERTKGKPLKMKQEYFPTLEEYLTNIGALEWFLIENNEGEGRKVVYANTTGAKGLPTYHLKIIDIRDIGEHQAYDIEVINTENFVANGVISHNCTVSHGMAQFLKEVLLDKSDIYTVYVCDLCGLFAEKKLDRPVWKCPSCPSTSNMTGSNNTKISKYVVPYAFKLLSQELMSMLVAMRMRPVKTIYNDGIY